jgi:hypothetical protein
MSRGTGGGREIRRHLGLPPAGLAGARHGGRVEVKTGS